MSNGPDFCHTCDRLAQVVQGQGECKNGVCTITVDRSNIAATLMGRRIRSEEILGIGLTFEGPDKAGRTLNTVEAALLPEEVNRFLFVLAHFGLTVTAMHNHWLFDQPHLIYLHAIAVGDPFQFAHAVAEASKTLTVPVKPAKG